MCGPLRHHGTNYGEVPGFEPYSASIFKACLPPNLLDYRNHNSGSSFGLKKFRSSFKVLLYFSTSQEPELMPEVMSDDAFDESEIDELDEDADAIYENNQWESCN
jgi:hypothetical protein